MIFMENGTILLPLNVQLNYGQILNSEEAFTWQEGYGAFSVGISQIKKTKEYIANQENHHRTQTFQEEFIQFLKKHEIQYNENNGWG